MTCHSVTGYSGGGKRLIEAHEEKPGRVLPSRPYALGLKHKHVPEMQEYTGLRFSPLFTPVVGHFYQGMIVMVPLVVRMLAKKVTPEDVREILSEYYGGSPFIRVFPANAEAELKASISPQRPAMTPTTLRVPPSVPRGTDTRRRAVR